jgi:nucleoid-associated protein
MELKKIIIHELIKEQKLTLANEYLSSSVYDINGDTIDLADRLNRSFIRDSITYAIFKIEEGDKFPNYFSHYQLSGQQNLDFVTFTRSAIMNLKQIISPIIFASGGYFVFAEYQEGNINYVSVFLIRDEKGLVFRKKQDGKGFEINSVSHLNTSKLAMGCRINIDRYKNNDGKYLALIKNKSRELFQSLDFN